METLIGLLFWGGIAYYLYMKFFQNKGTRTHIEDSFVYKNNRAGFSPKTEAQKIIEAKEIASNVKTHRGLEGLQDKIDTLGEKMDDYHFDENERMYNKTEEKQSIMEMALEYAGSNPYRYYYGAEPDTDTPLRELGVIGKTISVKKYNELDEELRGKFDVITLEDAESVEEANEYAVGDILIEGDELKDLKAFRQIIESDETDEEKEKKFNKLVSKSEYLIDELYLDENEEESLYDQYKYIQIMDAKIVKLYPLPCANFFVNHGYEDIEKISTLSDEEIRSMEGIGPKRLSEIRGYLNGIKTSK